jgi:CCR4-NOT transcription complex subunit 1
MNSSDENPPRFNPTTHNDDLTKERVMFQLNNTSSVNVEEKAKEIGSMIPLHLLEWFVEYIIDVRVSKEGNFHPVYLKLLSNL